MTTANRFVASAVLGTTRLELLRTAPDSTRLLLWKKRAISTGDKFTLRSQDYRAANADSGLPPKLHLATTLADYQTDDILVHAISEVFIFLGGLSRDDADLAAFFSIATHFTECHDPSLRGVVGAADPWDASRFLRLLACFCRHALPTAAFNRIQLLGLPAGCTPTFLISNPDTSRSINAFLTATQHSGFAVFQSGRSVSTPFSAVILEADRNLTNIAPSSFCRLDATPRFRPPLVDETTLQKIQDTFQPQLLKYRLENYSQVAAENCDTAKLGGSTRALASTLGSSFPKNKAMQARVVEVLTLQDLDRKFDSTSGEVSVVIDAMLILCHQGKKEIHVGEVAENANTILSNRGDGYQLASRRVGALLGPFRLGRTRDRRGYKFLLSAATKRRIHDLGRSYDVPFFKEDVQPCAFCRASETQGADDLASRPG